MPEVVATGNSIASAAFPARRIAIVPTEASSTVSCPLVRLKSAFVFTPDMEAVSPEKSVPSELLMFITKLDNL